MGELNIMQIMPTAPADFAPKERPALPELLACLNLAVGRGDQMLINATMDYINKVTSGSVPEHMDGCSCPWRYMTCLKSQPVLSSQKEDFNTDPLCSNESDQTVSFTESLSDVTDVKETDLSCDKQIENHLKRKRIRTLTEESEQTGSEEESCESPQQERKKHTKRKVIKGVAITAWAIASPVMLTLNLLRGSNDNDDDDDKCDDPLRPWNYKVKYQRPSKR